MGAHAVYKGNKVKTPNHVRSSYKYEKLNRIICLFQRVLVLNQKDKRTLFVPCVTLGNFKP